MKKFIFILGIILSINCVMANGLLDNIENTLYGFTYTNNDDTTRLSRIEQSVYGEAKTGSVSERINHIKNDMSADLIGKEIPPKEDTFLDEEDKIAKQEEIPPKAANVDYPSINELEKEIFKQEFKTKDLNTRLSELEKEALGKTYDNDAFSDRVERLQAKVKPKSFTNNSIAQSSNQYFDEDVIPLDKNYKLDEYRAPDFDYESYNAQHIPTGKSNLASVEKSIFKKSFTDEEIENRISRLESTMFGTTFDSDPQSTRLNRITSAYKATKTSGKYDSNKFAQNMATAMQIGTIILMILACVL